MADNILRKRFPGLLRAALLLAFAGTLSSCAGGKSGLFLHPKFNFNSIEAVAVVPFENLSGDQGASMRFTRIFIAELLAKKVFDVVEPGEVSKVLEKYTLVRAADLRKDQFQEMGKALHVQAVFLGSVSESAAVRNGGSSSTEVALTARLVETENGTTIWSATYTDGGRNLFQALLGLDPPTKSAATISCVKGIIGTLIK